MILFCKQNLNDNLVSIPIYLHRSFRAPMKLYFFQSIQGNYAKEFNAQCWIQNTRVMNTFTLIVLTIATIVRLFVIVPNRESHFIKYQTHAEINLFFILVSLFFGIVQLWIYSRKKVSLNRYANHLAWLYSLAFVGGGIWVSFIAQHNPSNTFTLLFIGLFTVAATTVFSLLQVLGIIATSVVVYISGVMYFHVKPEILIINIILFSLVLICYFAISRFSYSFHVNNFVKVKTIEEKNRQIEAGDRSKNEILGIVAHDLRSPVANIQSLLELMEHEQSTAEEQKTYMAHIKTCCTKAELIIREIIIAAQEEDGKPLKLEKTNLNRFLSDTHKGIQRLANGNHRFSLILPKHEVILMVNKEKLQRVFDNLLSNAMKFTPQNGEITIELEADAQQVRMYVRDKGIGIPQNQLPFLFDKFTSSGRVGLNKESSIGLGLHITKQLVEKHNGTITVESEEHKGTSFCITLPKQL